MDAGTATSAPPLPSTPGHVLRSLSGQAAANANSPAKIAAANANARLHVPQRVSPPPSHDHHDEAAGSHKPNVNVTVRNLPKAACVKAVACGTALHVVAGTSVKTGLSHTPLATSSAGGTVNTNASAKSGRSQAAAAGTANTAAGNGQPQPAPPAPTAPNASPAAAPAIPPTPSSLAAQQRAAALSVIPYQTAVNAADAHLKAVQADPNHTPDDIKAANSALDTANRQLDSAETASLLSIEKSNSQSGPEADASYQGIDINGMGGNISRVTDYLSTRPAGWIAMMSAYNVAIDVPFSNLMGDPTYVATYQKYIFSEARGYGGPLGDKTMYGFRPGVDMVGIDQPIIISPPPWPSTESDTSDGAGHEISHWIDAAGPDYLGKTPLTTVDGSASGNKAAKLSLSGAFGDAYDASLSNVSALPSSALTTNDAKSLHFAEWAPGGYYNQKPAQNVSAATALEYSKSETFAEYNAMYNNPACDKAFNDSGPLAPLYDYIRKFNEALDSKVPHP